MAKRLLYFFAIILLSSFIKDNPAYGLFTEKGKKADYSDLIKAASSADIILFGEEHNNPISHWLQLELTSDLLDEKGDQFNSKLFAAFIQKRLNSSKEILFVVGGAYGFSDALYSRANFKVALSKMTFTHQMIRLFFTEQLYRGFTILRGEKYHND